ncbi:MAG: sigma-70 family RNA polymerase sigma factor [Rhodoferax sp.]
MNGNAWDAACDAQGEPDDETLIKAVLDGETDCFSPLVTRYQTRVMRFILKYEYNTHDAQDLAQETFLQAFRALPSFNHQARFSTWLTGIAFNLIKNHISRSPTKQHAHLDIDDQPEGASDAARDDPARDYENRRLLAAMAQAVAALPPHMRDAIVLVASEGLSYEEAADTLEVPVGTVKSRLCRARVQLADALRVYRVA